MSSSLNFHNAVSITLEAHEYDGARTIEFHIAGDMHWHNRHETTAFVSIEDFPHFKRAVEAFNEAMTEWREIQAGANDRAF